MSRRGNFYGIGFRARVKPGPRMSPRQERDELADIELAAKRWEALAPRLGFCGSCGARVNESEGRLHDEGCIPGQPERCQPGQRS